MSIFYTVNHFFHCNKVNYRYSRTSQRFIVSPLFLLSIHVILNTNNGHLQLRIRAFLLFYGCFYLSSVLIKIVLWMNFITFLDNTISVFTLYNINDSIYVLSKEKIGVNFDTILTAAIFLLFAKAAIMTLCIYTNIRIGMHCI